MDHQYKYEINGLTMYTNERKVTIGLKSGEKVIVTTQEEIDKLGLNIKDSLPPSKKKETFNVDEGEE